VKAPLAAALRAVLVEAACMLRRLSRRRTVPATLALAAALLGYAALVNPVVTARDALSAAAAIAAIVVLVLATGIVDDDRERARLALAATHPAPPPVWVVGRWLAVLGAAAAAFAVAAAVLLAVARGPRPAAGVALGAVAALAHLAALAALAVALSCGLGSAPQLLVLLAVLGLGAVPPQIAAAALGHPAEVVVRTLWAALPTSWALSRLHGWILAAGPAGPWLAVALALQPALWLGAGARRLGAAELAVRAG